MDIVYGNTIKLWHTLTRTYSIKQSSKIKIEVSSINITKFDHLTNIQKVQNKNLQVYCKSFWERGNVWDKVQKSVSDMYENET